MSYLIDAVVNVNYVHCVSDFVLFVLISKHFSTNCRLRQNKHSDGDSL